MEPLRFKPEKKIRNAVIYAVMSFFIAAALMHFSTFAPAMSTVYRVTCVIAAAVGIQITSRFVMSDYEYALDEDKFIVFRTAGNKKTEVCNVTLKAVCGAYRNTSRKVIETAHGKVKMRLNFCQNLRSGDVCVFIFDFEGKKMSVAFEYNEGFFIEFKYRMDLFKEKKDEDE